MSFVQTYTSKGFELDDSNTDVLYNGTFFDNDELPSFGYNRKYELTDEELRKELGLKLRPTGFTQDDENELFNDRNGSDAKTVELDICINTDASQIAITTGDLIASWQKSGRNYFHYKSNQSVIHFYPIVSARYELFKENYMLNNKPISLEIYYHKGHQYNLKRMMDAMKLSLKYYSKQFSPYPYSQLRIAEFPRYQSFAQSFPTLIPFSESSGFVLNIDDKKDVDMAFFITAHEVAHQWWGCQLQAANVHGKNMILETLSQYAALMVFKEKFPQIKVEEFLNLQSNLFKKAQAKAKKIEKPLIHVDDESHIYYNKGALAMYEFQKQIGEQNVNTALQEFLSEWGNSKNRNEFKRYATTKDLLFYFKKNTPIDKQQLIKDLFESIN